MPFCPGTSAALATLVLLAAPGLLPPPLMHSASPVRTTWICASSPSPASLAETVTVDPDVVKVRSQTHVREALAVGGSDESVASA